VGAGSATCKTVVQYEFQYFWSLGYSTQYYPYRSTGYGVLVYHNRSRLLYVSSMVIDRFQTPNSKPPTSQSTSEPTFHHLPPCRLLLVPLEPAPRQGVPTW
jgi:hypothetical protein